MPGTKIPIGLINSGVTAKLSELVKPGFTGQSKTPKGILSSPALQNLPPQDTRDSPVKIIAEAAREPVLPAREFFMQTAAALRQPKDPLSTALLAFVRFFSLSPTLLGYLRRETLASLKSASPGSPKETAVLESRALAASAALDKGLSLSPAILEHYARYFVPPALWDKSSQQEIPDREEAPSAEELEALIEEQTSAEDFLDFLNYLPGKNGQKWLVFPFCIKVKDTELRVFLRVLKKEYGEGENLIADISGPKRQWRCFIRGRAGKFRADIRVYPELSVRSLKILSKKAEIFFSGSEEIEEILVQNGEEIPSWVEDLYNEPLPFIDKEV